MVSTGSEHVSVGKNSGDGGEMDAKPMSPQEKQPVETNNPIAVGGLPAVRESVLGKKIPSSSDEESCMNGSIDKLEANASTATMEDAPSGSISEEMTWTERTIAVAEYEIMKAKGLVVKKKKKESAANYAFRVLRTIVGPSLRYDTLRLSLKKHKYDVGKAMTDLIGPQMKETAGSTLVSSAGVGTVVEEGKISDKSLVKEPRGCPQGQRSKCGRAKISSDAESADGSSAVDEVAEVLDHIGNNSSQELHQGASDFDLKPGKNPPPKEMMETVGMEGSDVRVSVGFPNSADQTEKEISRENGVAVPENVSKTSTTDVPHCCNNDNLMELKSAVNTHQSSRVVDTGPKEGQSSEVAGVCARTQLAPQSSMTSSESATREDQNHKCKTSAKGEASQSDLADQLGVSLMSTLSATPLETGNIGTSDESAKGQAEKSSEGKEKEYVSSRAAPGRDVPSSPVRTDNLHESRSPSRVDTPEKAPSKKSYQSGDGSGNSGKGRLDDTCLGAPITKIVRCGESPMRKGTKSVGDGPREVQASVGNDSDGVTLEKTSQDTKCFEGGSQPTSRCAAAVSYLTSSRAGPGGSEDVYPTAERPRVMQSTLPKSTASSVSDCRKEGISQDKLSTTVGTSREHLSDEREDHSQISMSSSLDARNAAAKKYFSNFPNAATPLPSHYPRSEADPDASGSNSIEDKYRDEVLRRIRFECTAAMAKRSSESSGGVTGVLEFGDFLVCHICKKRKDNCAVFACGIQSHVFCEKHCADRLGFSTRDARGSIDPFVLDYCPVCSLACLCAKCRRKLDAISGALKALCITRGLEEDPSKCEMETLQLAVGQARLPPPRAGAMASHCKENIDASKSVSQNTADPFIASTSRNGKCATQALKPHEEKEGGKLRSEKNAGQSRKKQRTQKRASAQRNRALEAKDSCQRNALVSQMKAKARPPRDAEKVVLLRCKEFLSAKREKARNQVAGVPNQALIDSGLSTSSHLGASPETSDCQRTQSKAPESTSNKSLMRERDVARADSERNLAAIEKLKADIALLIDATKERDKAKADINRLRLKEIELSAENSKLTGHLRKERDVARADAERYLAIIDELRADNAVLVNARKELDKAKAETSRLRLKGAKLTAENAELAASEGHLRKECDDAIQQHNKVSKLAEKRAKELKVAKVSILQLREEKEVLKARLREVSPSGMEAKQNMLMLEKNAALSEVERLKKMVKDFQEYVNGTDAVVAGSNATRAKRFPDGMLPTTIAEKDDKSLSRCKKQIGRESKLGEEKSASTKVDNLASRAKKRSATDEIDNTFGGKRPNMTTRDSSSSLACMRSPVWEQVGPTEAKKRGENSESISPTSVADLSQQCKDPVLSHSVEIQRDSVRLQHWQFQYAARAQGQLQEFVQGLDRPAQLLQIERSRQLVATDEMPVHNSLRVTDERMKGLHSEISRLQAGNKDLQERVAVTCPQQEHLPSTACSQDAKVSASEKPHVPL